MADQENNQNRWEDSYLRQSHDAHVGRLMSGLSHNLNGVVQAFSMQSDLLAMMFPKAVELISRLEEKTGDSLPEELATLKELLQSRAGLVEQALEKVCSGQEILRRVSSLAAFQKSLEGGASTLNDYVRSIIEFQSGDSFFKHKVQKEFNLTDPLPGLVAGNLIAYQSISALVENAIEAMMDSTISPQIQINTKADGNNVVMEIQDSGTGIQPHEIGHIFEPFFSTKENHAGLGLYLAKKNIEDLGGQINCQSTPGATQFVISLPCRS